MNWDAFGALAEGLGALVVIASVIYLGKQVHDNTKQASADSQSRIVENWIRILDSMTSDERVTSAVRKSYSGLQTMSDDEKFIAYMRFASMVNHLEMVLRLEKQGLVPAETSETFGNIIAMLLATPGWEEFWSLDGGLAVPLTASYLKDRASPESGTMPFTDVIPFFAYSKE